MDKLVYTALGAATNQSFQRVQLTNDLANVSTVGYKKSTTSRPETVSYGGSGLSSRYQAVTPSRVEVVDLAPGHHMQTGNPTDIAMNNSTVLGVQGQDGETAFTRRGDLRITETGLLEIGSGQLVLDDGGNPITVPAETIISIGTDGVVYGSDSTTPGLESVPIASLLLRDASTTSLTRRSDGLYEAIDLDGQSGDFATGPEPISVTPGSLEGSNSDAVEIMVSLLDYYRSFETQMKIIKSTEEIDKDGSRMMSVG
jgi:flagellar basal-body rod protein FlgF